MGVWKCSFGFLASAVQEGRRKEIEIGIEVGPSCPLHIQAHSLLHLDYSFSHTAGIYSVSAKYLGLD